MSKLNFQNPEKTYLPCKRKQTFVQPKSNINIFWVMQTFHDQTTLHDDSHKNTLDVLFASNVWIPKNIRFGLKKPLDFNKNLENLGIWWKHLFNKKLWSRFLFSAGPPGRAWGPPSRAPVGGWRGCGGGPSREVGRGAKGVRRQEGRRAGRGGGRGGGHKKFFIGFCSLK